MAPERFGKKVTYQSIRELSENRDLLCSGCEQELSETENKREDYWIIDDYHHSSADLNL